MDPHSIPTAPAAIPPGLLLDDMPGANPTARKLNFALYRRGLLSQQAQKGLLKRLAGLEGKV